MPPYKLTPEVHERIVEVFAVGGTGKMAAGCAGISYMTLARWIQAGESSEGDTPERKLCEAIKKAEAECFRNALQKIIDASDKNWTAAAWLLERKLSDEFGKKIEVKGLSESVYQGMMATAREMMGDDMFRVFLEKVKEQAGDALPEKLIKEAA